MAKSSTKPARTEITKNIHKNWFDFSSAYTDKIKLQFLCIKHDTNPLFFVCGRAELLLQIPATSQQHTKHYQQ